MQAQDTWAGRKNKRESNKGTGKTALNSGKKQITKNNNPKTSAKHCVPHVK